MKYAKALALPILLIIIVSMFSGCNTIKTDIENREFMKHAVWGEYIDSTPPQVKFENQTYTVSNENIEYDKLDKRVGVVEKDSGRSCWIYTVKDKKRSEEIAVYNLNNDGKFVTADAATK